MNMLRVREPRRRSTRTDIMQGVVFPDYGLSDHTGKHRKLSGLQVRDPRCPGFYGSGRQKQRRITTLNGRKPAFGVTSVGQDFPWKR
jgi:hypothetical protein